jgi:hypothetical protein
MPHYDFMNTITIEANTEEEAVDIFYKLTEHLGKDICLSEMETKE